MRAAADAAASALDRVIPVLRRLSAGGIWIGGGLFTAYALGVGIEVVMRRFFSHSFGGLDEIGGYLLAVVATLAFTETLLHRGHIRIDIVFARLSRTAQVALDLLALAGLLVFFALLLEYAWTLFWRSWTMSVRSMTPLAVPLWIPQGLWVLGLALFVAVCAILFLRALIALAQGDRATAQALIGARSADDELAEEMALSAEAGAHHGSATP